MPPIEVKTNKTFTDLYGDHYNNVVVFGNPDETKEFQAHIKMQFWGEDTITVFEPETKGEAVVKGERIELDMAARKFEWFQNQKNAHVVDEAERFVSEIKWLVTLKEKPAKNTYEFRLGGNWQDFEWNYQYPLSDDFGEMVDFVGPDGDVWIRPKNWESLDSWCQRPKEIEGSYVVKHKIKRDYVLGGKNYRTGKVMQILAPVATDAQGKTLRTDLNITNGVYRVTIDQKFLDTAVYPIIINDSFGYWSGGASEYIDGSGGQLVVGGPWAPDSDGSATKIWSYTRAGGDFTMGFYLPDGAAGHPSTLVDDDEGGHTTTAVAWVEGTLDSAQSVVSTTAYFIGAMCNDTIAYRYDSGSGSHVTKPSLSYTSGTLPTFPATPTAYSGRDASFYLVYTPTASDPELAGTAGGVSGADASLSVKRTLSGSAAGSSGADASINVARQLAGSAAAVSGADASLSVKRTLAGSAAAVSGAAATLQKKTPLAGSAGATSGASAALSVKRTLAGAVAAVSGAACRLSMAGQTTLAGTVSAVSGASCSMKVARSLSGSAAGASGAAASLKVKRTLSGSAAAVSSVTSTLTVTAEALETLSGTVDAVSGASCSMKVARSLSGSAGGVSSASGVLSVKRTLAGSSAAISGASCTLRSGGQAEALAGVVNVVSSVSGVLSVSTPSTLMAQMHADMIMILNDLGTPFAVERKDVSYSGGVGTVSWRGIYASLDAVWQPVDGKTIREEQGLQEKTTAMIQVVKAADIQADDRVWESGKERLYVNYVREFEDHKTIYLKQTVGAA